jgi:hypothetical protein
MNDGHERDFMSLPLEVYGDMKVFLGEIGVRITENDILIEDCLNGKESVFHVDDTTILLSYYESGSYSNNNNAFSYAMLLVCPEGYVVDFAIIRGIDLVDSDRQCPTKYDVTMRKNSFD